MTAFPLFTVGSLPKKDRNASVQTVFFRWEILRRYFFSAPLKEIQKEPIKFVLFLTGGVEHELLQLATDISGPFVLIAHPGYNSLPAAMEATAALRERGARVELLHLGDPETEENLEALATVAKLARWLKGKRVGILGKPSPWLVASLPDLPILEEKLGLSFINLPIEDVNPLTVTDLPKGERVEPGVDELRMGAGVYAWLRNLVDEAGLDAFTIACFDLLPRKMTACWAIARLSSEGIPAGCEGDVNSLVALMVSQALAGGPGFMANPVDINPKRERLILAHCTAPFALVEDHRLRSHFESGIGLAVEGKLPKGPYTLVRFGGKRLEKGFFVEGSVLAEEVEGEDFCRTRVVFKASKGALRKLLQEPLGNHHVLIPGHHRRVLEAFHRLFLTEDDYARPTN